LATLAHNGATAGKIAKENGIDFTLGVLKKANQGNVSDTKFDE